jgi:predicted transcriptional regulator
MKCLIYVTKSKQWLFFDKSINYYSLSNKKVDNDLNGKIVAEFDGEVEEITKSISSVVEEWYSKELLKKSCLTAFELDDYLKGKTGYAIHIKNLVADGWRDLEEFLTCGRDNVFKHAKRPPQNMMKVWEPAYPIYCYSYPSIKDEYILISIRPEWACKILNGEKTIEVRRKVLKEML